MIRNPNYKTCLCLVLAATVLCATNSLRAASGTWTADSDGNWSDTNDWAGYMVADGTGNTADFSTVVMTADHTVTLDAAHTISTLNFGDANTTPEFNWTLTGTNLLTLGTAPLFNIVDDTATIAVPLAGTTGLTKSGSGTLTFLGANSYSGATLITNGVVNYNGSSHGASSGIFNVGGVNGRAVVNIDTTGGITNTGSYYGIGGTQPDTTDTGVGVLHILAGTFATGNNNNYTEVGTGGLNGGGSYGCITLQAGGTYSTLGNSGARFGAGGVGVLYQTGGTLNSTRWFALGSQAGGGGTANAGGVGEAIILGGTATVASGYRILLSDKSGGRGTLDLGTEAGGTAVVSALNTSTTSGGIDFVDSGGTNAQGTLNLNSGTLRMAGTMYHNNSAGVAEVNWNGATYQANGNNYNIFNVANAFIVNVFNGGVVIDDQANTNTCAAPLLAPGGNGLYPAGGTLAVTGGGSGYIGIPVVTVTNTGFGSNVMAVANLSGGSITSVAITSPGENLSVGDVLGFVFTGGGATTPASPFIYTLTASDLATNTAGGLTKLGAGMLVLTVSNSYQGNTVVSAGTLDVQADGGLGGGSVSVANGATLILEDGITNSYVSDTGYFILGGTATADLNYTGTNAVYALSLDGGVTYVTPGTWGASGSAANNQDSHFTGSGVLSVASSPSVTVAVTSSLDPSIFSQSVTLTATVTGNHGTATGTVTFKDGTTVLGTATLSGGKGTLTTSALVDGSHSITAVYGGNANYGQTTSLPLTQTVTVDSDFWTGSISGTWDINGTKNWRTLAGSGSGTYLDGDNVQMDDTATGGTAVELDTTVNPASFVVTNDVLNYSISGTGTIAGTTGLNKLGTGSLTLNVASAYTGTTTVSNGVVTYGPGSSVTGNGSLIVGADVVPAVLNINTTNTLNFNGVDSIGGVVGDTGDAGAGAIRQTAGTFNCSASSDLYLEIGTGGSAAYGDYELIGGTLNNANSSGIRVGCAGTGIFNQSGGVLNCARYFAVGSQSGSANVGGTGVATFTGGAATISSSYRIIVGDKPSSVGVFNLGTAAGGTAAVTNLYNSGGIGFLLVGDTSATSGTLNLNRGLLQLGAAIYRNENSMGVGLVDWNGATLQAGADDISLITNTPSSLTADLVAEIYNGGAVVDSGTNTCSLDVDLVAPTGNGIYPANGTLPVTDSGTGYIGAPVVTIGGGSGTGALAVANMTNGGIASLTLTCPGQGYVVGDVLSFTYTGGGASVAANSSSYTLQAGDLKANATGGLVKLGSGLLALTTANNTYLGATVISNGTLAVNGSLIGGGAVNVAGGVLGGAGLVAGPVTVQSGATLAADLGAVGAFNLDNNVTLLPGAVCSLKLNEGAGTNDIIQGVNEFTFGGTLVLTNLSGTLAAGNSFKLFSATNYTGSFSAIVPAIPGTGLAWDTTQLTANGTLNVVVGSSPSSNSTNLTFSVTGANLVIFWPADHTGWRLQSQTNAPSVGLGTNWVDWIGSTGTNQLTIPLDPANGSVFFRLKQ